MVMSESDAPQVNVNIDSSQFAGLMSIFVLTVLNVALKRD